jgi:hypothetical protein
MRTSGQDFRLYARLLAVPFVLSLLDAFLTLYYQPAAYWQGDRSQLVEFNPIAWLALRIHPAMLIPGFIGWYFLFFCFIFRTPAWIGLRCHVFLLCDHLIGITGWLVRHHPHGITLSAVNGLVTVAVSALCLSPFRSQWNGLQRIHLPLKAEVA